MAARFVALPDDRRIVGLGEAPGGVDERRVPAPAVGSGYSHALLQEVKRRLGAHAAARGDIVRASVFRAGSGVDEDDVERFQRMADALRARRQRRRRWRHSRRRNGGSRASPRSESTIRAAPRRSSRRARPRSSSDDSATARRDVCRCGSRAAHARPPTPARPADPPSSARERTAGFAAGSAGDRCTRSWDLAPADRPGRRSAAARKCR